MLDAARVCLADSGYQGLDKLFAQVQTPKKKSKKHPLTDQERADNRGLSSQRIRCEHIIGRLKVFKILAERYRNRRKRFGLRVNLIAALCNLQRTGPHLQRLLATIYATKPLHCMSFSVNGGFLQLGF